MNSVECLCVISYKCPNCDEKNILRLNYENGTVNPGLCTNCHEEHGLEELYRLYTSQFDSMKDWLENSHDLICSHIRMFICDECGTENLIAPTKVIMKDIAGLGMIEIPEFNGKKNPEIGKCDECNSEFNLIHPKVEALNRPKLRRK